MNVQSKMRLAESERFWPFLILAYFLLHTIYRTLMGGALGLDEAQIMLDAQDFRLGYGPQLPLYAWFQRLVFLLTGSNILGLALAKNALLCGMTLTLYFVIRSQHPPRMAGLAAASILLLPQISWENQRALTHSVLVNFSAIVTFGVVWWIALRPTFAAFVVLGLALTIGGLSKYNYVLLPVAVLLASATLPQIRKHVWSPLILVSLAVAVTLLVLPAQWVVQNPDQALASAGKFKISDAGSFLQTALKGLGAFSSGVVGFVGFAMLVSGGLFWFFRQRGQPGQIETTSLNQLMNRTLVFGLLVILLAILASGATQIRERWLQPVLIFSAPAMILWLVPRLTNKGVKNLGRVLLGLAMLILLALPFHNMYGRAYRAAPFDTLAPEIIEPLAPDTILLAPTWIAGNLFYAAPETPIINADFSKSPINPTQSYALVWQGSSLKRGQRYLSKKLGDHPQWKLRDHRVLSGGYRFATDQKFTLSVARITMVSQ